MCLINEVLLFLWGLFALITGRLILSSQLKLESSRARIAGIFLILPMILAIGMGIFLGILVGLGFLDREIFDYSIFVECIFSLLGILGAVIYAYKTQPVEPMDSFKNWMA